MNNTAEGGKLIATNMTEWNRLYKFRQTLNPDEKKARLKLEAAAWRAEVDRQVLAAHEFFAATDAIVATGAPEEIREYYRDNYTMGDSDEAFAVFTRNHGAAC